MEEEEDAAPRPSLEAAPGAAAEATSAPEEAVDALAEAVSRLSVGERPRHAPVCSLYTSFRCLNTERLCGHYSSILFGLNPVPHAPRSCLARASQHPQRPLPHGNNPWRSLRPRLRRSLRQQPSRMWRRRRRRS